MKQLLIISAISPKGFWRCGTFFSHEGETVSVSDFDDKQWGILKDEPNLRIVPASQAELDEAERRKAMIAEVIDGLGVAGFTDKGAPKTELLNAALSEELGKISAKERDAVFAEMIDAGFTVPTKDT